LSRASRENRDQLIELMGGLYKHGNPSGSANLADIPDLPDSSISSDSSER
jgi:hypothetical protein